MQLWARNSVFYCRTSKWFPLTVGGPLAVTCSFPWSPANISCNPTVYTPLETLRVSTWIWSYSRTTCLSYIAGWEHAKHFSLLFFYLNASNCIRCCRSFSSCLLCVCQCAPVAGISRRQSSSCTQYVLLHATYNRNTSAELFACSVHSHVDTQMKRVILLLMTPTESV